VKFVCAHCGKPGDKLTGEVNRALKSGRNLYCGRECSGLGRRDGKTAEQRKLEKKLYDREYRLRDIEARKAKKRAYHLATYDPDKARVKRKAKMPQHVEYCRQPEYRRWKSGYDRKYRSKKFYGPFAEAAMLAIDLNREIKGRMSNHEIRQQNGTANKSQLRARKAGEKERSRPRNRYRRRDHSTAHSQ
jgi:hypothetical protein